MAFSFGAAIAALTGTLFVALNGAVFAGNFDLTLLITIYAMMILGGIGSQAGAVLGAILISVLLELLREPSNSRYIFYVALLLGLVAMFRFSARLVVVAGGVVLLGVVIRLVVDRVDSSWAGAAPEDSGWLGDLVARWVVEPSSVTPWVKAVAYIVLDLSRAPAHDARRLGASRRARADALPRRVRLGERPRRRPDRRPATSCSEHFSSS